MITLENVSFQYAGAEKRNGLENINLTIAPGEVVLFCGESGCGKTTLTRLFNGLVPHFYPGKLTGNVRVGTIDPVTATIQATSEIVGSVFQNPRSQFFSTHSTAELIFACENHGLDKVEIDARLAGIAENQQTRGLLNRNIFTMSGGEKQLLACQSASICDNQVLVLDEPSANLDAVAIETLRKQLLQWKRQGKTLVIAEHRLYYLRDLADRLYVLEAGKITASYTREDWQKLTTADLQALGLRALQLDFQQPFPQAQAAERADSGEQTLRDDYLREVHFRYKKSSVENFSCQTAQFKKGVITAVVGHNGSGKSTFARIASGLEGKNCGIYETHNAKLPPKKRLAQSFLVMQDVNHQLFTESVLEEVLLSMSVPDAAKALELLTALDLAELAEEHPLSLSGGQKQRLAIASSLASEKSVLWFDEPTSGLDLKHMQQVVERLQQLAAQGKAVLVITHDWEFIQACCQEVIWIEKGTLVQQFSLNQQTQARLAELFALSALTLPAQ